MQSSRLSILGSLALLVFFAACATDDRRRGLVDAGDAAADAATDALGMEDSSGLDAEAPDGGVDAGSGDAGRDASARDASTRDAGPGALLPQSGDLAIVEIQGNPVQATDDQAEYIEILNVSGRTLDLSGVTITHLSFVGGEPDASADRHRVTTPLFVEAGERVLLGSSAGGFFGANDPDYVYSDILISNAETETTRFRLMIPGWDGTEPPNILDVVDEVIVESRLFGNAVRGQAWQYDPARGVPTAASNDDASNWCTTSTSADLEYRASNFGTPGDANECF